MSLLRHYLVFVLVLLSMQRADAAYKRQYISLHPTVSLRENVQYNKLSLIDHRGDTTSLGVFKGLYSYLDLATSRPFGEELAALDSGLFGLSNRGTGELLVVLHQHHYLEAGNNIRTMTLRADFFCRDSAEQRYRYLHTVDSFYETYRTKDPPDDFFAEVWQRCLLTAVKKSAYLPKTGQLFSVTEAVRREEDIRQQLPAYAAVDYPAGVYYSWEEFSQLRPGTRDVQVKRNDNNVLKPYSFYINDSSDKHGRRELKEEHFFAVYNGRQWYKTSSKRIYTMERGPDGHFYYSGVQAGLTSSNAKDAYLIPAFVVGGVIGVLVTAVVIDAAETRNGKHGNVLYRLRLGLDGRGVPVLRKD